jgi:hypothetical protein
MYLFTDYCSQEIWGMKRDAAGTWKHARVGTAPGMITSFGERNDGELVAVTDDGRLWSVTGRRE